ncbi:unnamed protein product [Lota lota]
MLTDRWTLKEKLWNPRESPIFTSGAVSIAATSLRASWFKRSRIQPMISPGRQERPRKGGARSLKNIWGPKPEEQVVNLLRGLVLGSPRVVMLTLGWAYGLL